MITLKSLESELGRRAYSEDIERLDPERLIQSQAPSGVLSDFKRSIRNYEDQQKTNQAYALHKKELARILEATQSIPLKDKLITEPALPTIFDLARSAKPKIQT